MKIQNIFILAYFTLSLWSCIPFHNDDEPDIFPQARYEPILMPRSDFENTTLYLPSRSILNSGKIYIKDQYLFINDTNEGFHFFNNSNPENPINIGFLKVLASTDLAIKNDILYVNNGPDLIALRPDINNDTFEITKRIVNIFPEALRWSPDGYYLGNLPEDQIIIGWELIE